ncbi:MAG: enolase C-terminal domain-like protein [Caldilineaceae bacterium]
MKISDVSILRLAGTFTSPPFPPGDRQAQQLDIYPEFNARNPASGVGSSRIEALYVEVQTDEGLRGWGADSGVQAFPIVKTLRPFLPGRDPLATELLYDQMIRLDRHGRSGYFMTAVSAVDCALWDLKGKAWGQPVYRLLGGPTRSAVPAYASMLSFSVDPEAAAQTAKEYRGLGYTAQKWFFRYGPGDGAVGLEKNLALAYAVREAVGGNYKLMFDAFMGWDATYAAEMLRKLEPIQPVWMEEPIPPEHVGSFQKLRQNTKVPLATGEHIYTRWQTKELLVNQAVDFLQNDPDWTGGITELSKVCALASAFDVPVVAHGHSLLPALHVAGAQSPGTVPFVEFLIRHQPAKQHFQTHFLQPENGSVTLPSGPGLGFVLDEAKIEERAELRY